MRRQEKSLQLTVEPDVDSVEQDGVSLVAAELVEVVPDVSSDRAAGFPKQREEGVPGNTDAHALAMRKIGGQAII